MTDFEQMVTADILKWSLKDTEQYMYMEEVDVILDYWNEYFQAAKW